MNSRFPGIICVIDQGTGGFWVSGNPGAGGKAATLIKYHFAPLPVGRQGDCAVEDTEGMFTTEGTEFLLEGLRGDGSAPW